MTVHKIDDVAAPLDRSGCYIDGALDEPQVGVGGTTYVLQIAGWAVGVPAPVLAVEVFAGRLKLQASPIATPRPDVASLFPGVEWAGQSGFSTAVSLLGFPGQFSFQVYVVTADGRRSLLGTITGVRRSLPTPPASLGVRPLLVTTLGRSGSTWLMRLLSHHPQVVAYRPFQRETRVSGYWLAVLATLLHPGSYVQPLSNAPLSTARWWAGDGRIPPPETVPAEIRAWLETENIEGIAQFCSMQIRRLYERLVDSEQRSADYFAEKISPGITPFLATDLFPNGRLIVLVRDPRDTLASIIAYTERYGTEHFGRSSVGSLEAYVDVLKSQAGELLETSMTARGAVIVRYEDLVTDPVDVLGRVLAHCKLDDTPDIVASMVSASAVSTPDERTHRTVDDPAHSVGRWKRDLSPSLQLACAEAFGDVLRSFGYD